ncbi:hypothetical protein OG204_14160 [Streptomyces sp. NBC_01387]|uniref:hypothetical protein n=1 Tax=unclassified Streptomyces TaxID=2593676 RepID=UPI0020243A3A|nr:MULTISPECIES: hypothetical protein [unclassified Streptomyces]MCX4550510.1 hypothetical protein [Streptomyces sp. NBC_01500]WSC21958.1 hypothetical protein OIE60_21010 [Streptomyces sp. NBC_01766]WSV55915.1 hypothetical protein OG282_20650 [Streptomyces sp. NBC_01014]
MTMHEDNPAPAQGVAITVDGATDALRNIDVARERAALNSRLMPAWYGPAAAAALIVPAAGEAWAGSKGAWGALLSLVLSLGGLAVVIALAVAVKRAARVQVSRSLSSRLRQRWLGLLVAVAAGVVAWVVCSLSGLGAGATRITVFTLWGLGVWCVCVVRNAAIKQKLGELV